MNTHTLIRNVILIPCVLLLGLCHAFAAASPLVVYSFSSAAERFLPTVQDGNLGAGNLAGGPDVTTMPGSTSGLAVSGQSLLFSNQRFYSADEASAISIGRWLEFTVDIAEGYEGVLSEISFFALRRAQNESGSPEGTGAPQAFSIYSSVDGFVGALGSGTIPLATTNDFSYFQVDLSAATALQRVKGSVTFRIVLWSPDGIGAGPAERIWRMDELMLEGVIRTEQDLPPCATTFHVAPYGDDANPGTIELPFATLERARDAIRELVCRQTEDIVVHVEPGDYFMEKPFFLELQDSGRDGHQIVYRAAAEPGSSRLIGGVLVEGWEAVDAHVFRAPVPTGIVFHTLYENGVRAYKARFPSRGFDARFPLWAGPYLRAERGTTSKLTWKEGDLEAISDVDLVGATLVVWPWGFRDWHKTPREILSVDSTGRLIEIDDIGVRMDPQARYFIEGKREFLDAPGEFHHDAQAGYLYYWPRFGDPESAEIIAPALHRIVEIQGGNAFLPVHDIVIEGFTLAYTDAFAYMEGLTMFPWSETSSAPHGIVHLRYTEDISIRFNHIKGSGMSGIYLERSNKQNLIYGNLIEDMGISGVVLAYHRQAAQFPQDSNSGNLIENNRILGLGSIAVDSTGVTIWGGQDNVIRYCEISDGARYGVSMRGPFTQWIPGQDSTTIGNTNRPLTRDNRIEYSHFHRLAQDSGDTAAVHMAGISSLIELPVNYLEQLLFEDILAHPSVLDMPPEAIYFDYTEGVTGQVLTDIEVRRTPNPYRTNRTDFRHVYENVSWRDGFDPSRMRYDEIGLRPDFPEAYDFPREVENARVREEVRGDERWLIVDWDWPSTGPASGGVVVTVEGASGFAEVEAPHPQSQAQIPFPSTERLADLRLRSRGAGGLLTPGVLVRAAEPPARALGFDVLGIEGGFELTWQHSGERVRDFRIVFPDTTLPTVELPAANRSWQAADLENHRTYAARVDVVDLDGHTWEGRELAVTAGVRQAPPADAAAWWSFNALRDGFSVPDKSGNGHSLAIGMGPVALTEGQYGRALQTDGIESHLRLHNPETLSIGTGGYAVSLWVKRTHSTNMGGRILEFGGGSRGVFEHWGQPVAPDTPGLLIHSADYTLGAVLNDGNRRYNATAGGVKVADQWLHIVVNIVRNDRMSLWVNGELLASEWITNALGRDITSGEPFIMGKSLQVDHPNLYWPGKIDQVRVFRRSLSVSEIADLFNEPSPGPFFPDELTFTPGEWTEDPVMGWLHGATGSWAYSPFMGWLELGAFPWVYQVKTGWIVYAHGFGSTPLWFFHPDMDWIFVPPERDGTFLRLDGDEWTEESFF